MKNIEYNVGLYVLGVTQIIPYCAECWKRLAGKGLGREREGVLKKDVKHLSGEVHDDPRRTETVVELGV